MALEVLTTLIPTADVWMAVRDRVALILATESANQVALAAGEPDPTLWKMRVYTQRAKPWEMFLPDIDGNLPTDFSPIIYVWHETHYYPGDAGDVVQHQQNDMTINVDSNGVPLVPPITRACVNT